MNTVNVKMGLSGRFKLETFKNGVKTKSTGWFNNLITDQGKDFFGVGNQYNHINYCRVGTGNTAPAVSDTNLVSHVAGALRDAGSDTTGNSGSSPWYTYIQRVYVFPAGFVGASSVNLAEIGTGTASSDGANLFSRALILDGVGNPTTLTVDTDEELRVTYELRMYPLETDISSSIIDSGTSVNHSYTLRACEVDQSNNWVPLGMTTSGTTGSVATDGAIGAIDGSPTGSGDIPTGVTVANYTNGNYYRDFTYTWGSGDGNFATGISAMKLFTNGKTSWQVGFSPAINKDNTQETSLTLRVSWDRATI